MFITYVNNRYSVCCHIYIECRHFVGMSYVLSYFNLNATYDIFGYL